MDRRIIVYPVFILWFCLFVSPMAEASRYALLIGISDYSRTEFQSLDGPNNDINLIQETLLNRFQFQKENIEVLINGSATHKKIEPLRYLVWAEGKTSGK